MAMICKHCGEALTSTASQQRGCCDVPRADSVEEQLSFWMSHDPEQICVNCDHEGCERRIVHV